jgi:hypothetical protein
MAKNGASLVGYTGGAWNKFADHMPRPVAVRLSKTLGRSEKEIKCTKKTLTFGPARIFTSLALTGWYMPAGW